LSMILSDKDIREEIRKGGIIIEPFNEAYLQPASVDLHLDKDFLVFNTLENFVIDVREKANNLMAAVTIDHNKPFILHPGEFALGLIMEKTGVSDCFVGRLEGKSSLGRLGLIIHTTAGYLDPGNSLKMTLELYNAGPLPIKLHYGMPIGQMAFETLSSACERPYGSKGLNSKYYGDAKPRASEMYRNFDFKAAEAATVSEKITIGQDGDRPAQGENHAAVAPTAATESKNHMYKIFVHDEFNPEDMAMLQALYSRSPQSVEEHVDKVKETGSGNFMEKFYVGYGHLSIADCGSTTMFIERLSILADKAVQDWPLYSGQETSTRYVDMSKQPIVDPLGTADSKAILDRWMKFYIESQAAVKDHLIKKYPKREEEKEEVYQKAITARAFDCLRGFLPAGITTQLSWHTNLRQAWDKISLLRHHPLREVQTIADDMLSKLKEKYGHSFSHKLYEEQESYRALASEKHDYFYPREAYSFNYKTNIAGDELHAYNDLLAARPQKTNLPHFLSELGNITFDFLLDFGSFRDIQRHRNGVCRMPLLTTDYGFNEWYLNQLPDETRVRAIGLIEEQIAAIDRLNASPEIKQYYISLGFNMACRVAYGLPAAVYVVELRSMKTVHPTLRKIAHKMHYALLDLFPNLKLHSDLNPDDWDIRRGMQDIVAK